MLEKKAAILHHSFFWAVFVNIMKGGMGGAIIMKFVWRGGSLCTYIVLSLLVAKAGPEGILVNQKPEREICSGEKLSGLSD